MSVTVLCIYTTVMLCALTCQETVICLTPDTAFTFEGAAEGAGRRGGVRRNEERGERRK